MINNGAAQGDTKRCRLSWLINSALVHEPKCEGKGGLRGLTNEYSSAHGAQINFGDVTPYLTYVATEQSGGDAKVKFCHLFHENQKINLDTYSFHGFYPPLRGKANLIFSSLRYKNIFEIYYFSCTVCTILLTIGWHRSAHFLNRFPFPNFWQLCPSC